MNEDDYQRLLQQAKKDKRRFKGYTSETREVNGRLVSSLVPNTVGRPGEAPKVDWGKTEFTQEVAKLPDPEKRSDRARVESLAARLWKAVEERRPAEMEIVLQAMQVEAWKRGDPISYDDVKRVAIAQMKLAAEKAKQKK